MLVNLASAALAFSSPSQSHATTRCGHPRLSATNTAALLFDCDGVLVETEELHRTAYNQAFEEFGLEIDGTPVVWSVDYYDHLANTVGGGKPKMRYHFTGLGAPEGATTHPDNAKVWPAVTKRDGSVPADEVAGMDLVDELQAFKTECYKKLVEVAPPRPGVLDLMDAAIADPHLAVGICSAATRGGFEKVVDAVVGQERLAKLDCIIAGDDVSNKKPSPEIYNVAASRLGLESSDCVVVEDSLVGLRAAKAAGMKCVITYTPQTADQDFYGEGADATLPDMGKGVPLDSLFTADGQVMEELLEGMADPRTGAYEYKPVSAIF
jgi:HAD superfamily hydrolase (TIGR01509 family)